MFGGVDRAFIANVSEAAALAHSRRATLIDFEEGRGNWADVGVNIQVLEPGQPNCRYHSEPVQEDFLVLVGECLVILDGEEVPLRRWDFVHCPAGTEHVFIGAGDGPCAVVMIGSRRAEGVHYPVNELAAAYDASVKTPTDDPEEAYADWRSEPRRRVPNPWPALTARERDGAEPGDPPGAGSRGAAGGAS